MIKENINEQYLNLLKDIQYNGVKKEDRTGTGTFSVFGRTLEMNMSDGFPLLTLKKMYTKGILAELLWFLEGSTDIRGLWKNNCHIWDGDWHNRYSKSCSSPYSLEEMIKKQDDTSFAKEVWDLGPIYGKQWRQWQGWIDAKDSSGKHIIGSLWYDQIGTLIQQLKTNPDSRRLMVNAWKVDEIESMTLPPCHYGFQCWTRELVIEERVQLAYHMKLIDYITLVETDELNKLNVPKRAISLIWQQRSCDTFLGIPFNIASYGFLLEMIAQQVNMIPEKLIGSLGDTHIYSNHIPFVKEMLDRDPKKYKLPKLILNKAEDIFSYKLSDFKIEEYEAYPNWKDVPLSN